MSTTQKCTNGTGGGSCGGTCFACQQQARRQELEDGGLCGLCLNCDALAGHEGLCDVRA
jgi:hypothetical protein